jgi:catechol 2,3-dioxygenase-like lactoylglutathione lyase family enzyme
VPTGSLPGLTRVDHVALTIPDLDEAVAFYTGALGGEEVYRLGPFDASEIPALPDGRDWTEAHVNVAGARLRFAGIRLGADFVVELFEYERPPGATTPPGNADVGGGHIGLKVADLDAALAFLRERGVQTFERIEVAEGSLAGMRGAYFLDPWGNHLELVEYDRLGYMADGPAD